MGLSILNIAYPFAPVSADTVGGSEQILYRIDSALTQAGHRSWVIACEGSIVAGELIATKPIKGPITKNKISDSHREYREAIHAAIEGKRPDVIHFHGVDCHAYLPATKLPMLVTLHCPITFYAAGLFEQSLPNLFMNCVSASQRRTLPERINILSEISNGVPPIETISTKSKKGFALVAGRICPEKNFHVALDAAKQARIPLYLAGATFQYERHEGYFKNEILPRLDKLRRYIGPIGGKQKWKLFSEATCTLIPSIAQETSSLVAMESLACGTPVVAFPSGALPEIIDDGITGFLVNSTQEMAEAIERTKSLSPGICRTVARERFSLERMNKEYLALYNTLADGIEVHPALP